MNISTQTNEEIQQINVPDWISNQLPAKDILLLEHGKKSSLVMIETPDGQEMTGKIQLFKGDKDVQINFYTPNQKLKFPELIENIKLNKAQLKALRKGEYIALSSGNKAKLDHELNKVLIYTSKELNIPIQIGANKLSQQQILDLLNSKTISITTLEQSHHNHIKTSLSFDHTTGKTSFDKGQTYIVDNQKRLDNTNSEVDPKDISRINNDYLITQFLEGNDKMLPKIIALTKEGFNPSIEKLVELTNNFSHSRSEALLSAFNQDSKSIVRLQEVNDNRILYDGMDQTKFKVVNIDLSTNQVTVQNKNGESRQTDLDSTLRTESEQKLYLQEKSLSLSPQKTLGLGK